jgi:hypothetical protein
MRHNFYHNSYGGTFIFVRPRLIMAFVAAEAAAKVS